MDTKFYSPQGVLKDFVDFIAFMGGQNWGTGIAFPRMHQVIIINMADNFLVSDIYAAAPKTKEVTETVWINGKQDVPFMLGNKGETAMYAIGLKLGMLPYFADLPAITTNDQAVGAEHWTSGEIFNLREQLMGVPDVQDGFALIERYLTLQLVKRDLSQFGKIKWLGSAMKTRRVEDICRSLGATRKKLRAETQHYFGGSVKNIQGIIRFNQTLADIANHTGATLSSLHHYYDQSHFINDFKARSGISPLQYKRLCQLHPAIKYTPNFISMQRETFLQFISPQPAYLG